MTEEERQHEIVARLHYLQRMFQDSPDACMAALSDQDFTEITRYFLDRMRKYETGDLSSSDFIAAMLYEYRNALSRAVVMQAVQEGLLDDEGASEEH